MRTFVQSKEKAREQAKWLVIDVAGKPVGRAASQIAALLRGKHKPTFTKHVNSGDFVIILNAAQVVFTGNKRSKKMYYNYSGFIGGMREQSADELLETYPERVIKAAVKGMLPRGALGHQIIDNLKVYAGSEHPHASQQPVPYELKN